MGHIGTSGRCSDITPAGCKFELSAGMGKVMARQDGEQTRERISSFVALNQGIHLSGIIRALELGNHPQMPLVCPQIARIDKIRSAFTRSLPSDSSLCRARMRGVGWVAIGPVLGVCQAWWELNLSNYRVFTRFFINYFLLSFSIFSLSTNRGSNFKEAGEKSTGPICVKNVLVI